MNGGGRGSKKNKIDCAIQALLSATKEEIQGQERSVVCARPKTHRLWTDLQGHGGVVRLSFLLLLLLPSPRSAPARGQAGAGTRQLAAAGELGVGGRGGACS